MPRQDNPRKIAVIGAGPAGLSAARFIKDAGHEVTVYEAEDRIGGKSYSVLHGDALNELGTCYTTRAHRIVKRWMKEYGIHLTRLGEARFDGRTVVEYVKSGSGAPLAVQAIKFVLASRRLRRAIAARPTDPEVCREASMTTQEWVRNLNLPKIELAMHRIQTTQGYGYIDEATIGQTVQWCDLDFILSGVLNQLHMPDEGWSEFWRRFSEDLNVRTSSPVLSLDRSGPRPVILAGGAREEFDAVLSTVPMQAFSAFSQPSEDEAFLTDAIEWQTYTTTLFSSPDWFEGYQVIGFSRASRDSSLRGAILGGRREGESEDLGGKLYVTGQFSKDLEPSELREILQAEADFHGFHIESVIQQKCWQYFPQYKAEAVRNGLFDVLRRVQGQQQTWFGGASFSHELVSNVVVHSQRIVGQMLAELSAQPKT
ncbi:MAG: FAD-dependent oxidoreductase [Alphaproteobacteria bacterium]|nr:FAD-dependent oxidoreductase [Alphaproteobacteria bacterium]